MPHVAYVRFCSHPGIRPEANETRNGVFRWLPASPTDPSPRNMRRRPPPPRQSRPLRARWSTAVLRYHDQALDQGAGRTLLRLSPGRLHDAEVEGRPWRPRPRAARSASCGNERESQIIRVMERPQRSRRSAALSSPVGEGTAKRWRGLPPHSARIETQRPVGAPPPRFARSPSPNGEENSACRISRQGVRQAQQGAGTRAARTTSSPFSPFSAAVAVSAVATPSTGIPVARTRARISSSEDWLWAGRPMPGRRDDQHPRPPANTVSYQARASRLRQEKVCGSNTTTSGRSGIVQLHSPRWPNGPSRRTSRSPR